jgi:hypothetical protein
MKYILWLTKLTYWVKCDISNRKLPQLGEYLKLTCATIALSRTLDSIRTSQWIVVLELNDNLISGKLQT